MTEKLKINPDSSLRCGYTCTSMCMNTKHCLSVLCVSGLSGGLVGLTLTYAMALMGLFQWGVRQSAEVENQVRTSRA